MNYCEYQSDQFCRKHGYTTDAEKAVVGEGMAFALRYARFYDSRREFQGALEEHLREQRAQRYGMDPITSVIAWFIVKQIVWLILEWCWEHIRFTSTFEDTAAEWPGTHDPNGNARTAESSPPSKSS